MACNRAVTNRLVVYLDYDFTPLCREELASSMPNMVEKQYDSLDSQRSLLSAWMERQDLQPLWYNRADDALVLVKNSHRQRK